MERKKRGSRIVSQKKKMFYLPEQQIITNTDPDNSDGFYTNLEQQVSNLTTRVNKIETTDKQLAQYIFNKYNEPVFLSGTHDFYSKELIDVVFHPKTTAMRLDLGKIYTIQYKLVFYNDNYENNNEDDCTTACYWTTMQNNNQLAFSTCRFKKFIGALNSGWQVAHEFVYSPFKRSDCFIKFIFGGGKKRQLDKSESFLIIRQV